MPDSLKKSGSIRFKTMHGFEMAANSIITIIWHDRFGKIN